MKLEQESQNLCQSQGLRPELPFRLLSPFLGFLPLGEVPLPVVPKQRREFVCSKVV